MCEELLRVAWGVGVGRGRSIGSEYHWPRHYLFPILCELLITNYYVLITVFALSCDTRHNWNKYLVQSMSYKYLVTFPKDYM